MNKKLLTVILIFSSLVGSRLFAETVKPDDDLQKKPKTLIYDGPNGDGNIENNIEIPNEFCYIKPGFVLKIIGFDEFENLVLLAIQDTPDNSCIKGSQFYLPRNFIDGSTYIQD